MRSRNVKLFDHVYRQTYICWLMIYGWVGGGGGGVRARGESRINCHSTALKQTRGTHGVTGGACLECIQSGMIPACRPNIPIVHSVAQSAFHPHIPIAAWMPCAFPPTNKRGFCCKITSYCDDYTRDHFICNLGTCSLIEIVTE